MRHRKDLWMVADMGVLAETQMLFVVLLGFAGLDWGTSCGNCTRSDQFGESHEQEVQGDKLQSTFQKEA